MSKLAITFSLILIYLCTFLDGCAYDAEPDNQLLINASSTENWSFAPPEIEDQFITQKLSVAHRFIPFQIILPTYFPDDVSPLPTIRGPLCLDRNYSRVRVTITYYLPLENKEPGWIFIYETNIHMIQENPERNPDYTYFDIKGKRTVKTEGNFSAGYGIIFDFDHQNTYYSVEIYNVPEEEAIKIVESMIEQMGPLF